MDGGRVVFRAMEIEWWFRRPRLYSIILSDFLVFLFFSLSLYLICLGSVSVVRYLGVALARSVVSFGRSADPVERRVINGMHCPVREGGDSL